MNDLIKPGWMWVAIVLGLGLVLSVGFGVGPAESHRFKVALVVASAEAGAEAGQGAGQGRDVRDGFMVATAERDGHPDQESDGHLGGLDVYVASVPVTGGMGKAVGRIAARGEVDIVALFGAEKISDGLRKSLARHGIAWLAAGRKPFSDAGQEATVKAAPSGVKAADKFATAYRKAFGRWASAQAAEGYLAARRIDVAVRAQGGVDNTELLQRSFTETADKFSW